MCQLVSYLFSDTSASLPFELTHPIVMNPRAVFPMVISLALQDNLAVFSVKEIHQCWVQRTRRDDLKMEKMLVDDSLIHLDNFG